jgi:hypothetical protein
VGVGEKNVAKGKKYTKKVPHNNVLLFTTGTTGHHQNSL